MRHCSLLFSASPFQTAGLRLLSGLPLAIGLLAGCGTASGHLSPRFVAVHNALTASGMAQTGSISEGSLPQGSDVRIPVELEGGQCYTFVALGSSQVANIDVQVLDEDGEEIASDATVDPQAAAQACPDRTGTYVLVVRMTDGQGTYTVSSWGGRAGGGGTAIASGPGGGTCSQPERIEIGTPVSGTTSEHANSTQGQCIGEGEAPEVVYLLEIQERTQISAILQSGFDGALYLLSRCGDSASEIACNDDSPDTTRSQIDATVEPGEYFLVVDGFGDESGDYELIVSSTQLQPLSQVCGDAPRLVPGQPVSGTTQGGANYFQATCAAGARSADRVYQLEAQTRSRVRIRQQTDHDGALYIRSNCENATSEVACNDDLADPQHSVITAVLEAGNYFVYSDGYGTGNMGGYSLTADLTPAAGGGATADACGAAGSLAAGPPVNVDTFEAQDDYAGSCGGQGSADVVYEINVRGRSRLRIGTDMAEFSGVMYLQSACGDQSAEVTCAPFPMGRGGQTERPIIDTVVAPGTYYLVVDGAHPDAFGSSSIVMRTDDITATERMCRTAPMIRPGRTASGDTSGEQDTFQASCAGSATSNDTVYRLRVTRRQDVRIDMTSNYDGSIHLRSDCVSASSEIACNDDHNDNRTAQITTTLDPGTYFLIVDGFSSGNAGTYSIDVEMAAPGSLPAAPQPPPQPPGTFGPTPKR